ncbi:MAG: hypothetical protein JWO36_3178 [Myxococcales bacterium]|nr:hypothetical protein [Myxococcales bacterium]
MIMLVCAVSAACRTDRPAPQPPIEFGSTVHLFGALEGISLGMPMPDVLAKVPTLKHVPKTPPSSDALPPPPPPPRRNGYVFPVFTSFELKTSNATYTLNALDGRLSSVEIEVQNRAPDALWKAWGAPTRTKEGFIKYDRDRGIRATISEYAVPPLTVTVENMMPLAKLIDPDPTRFAGALVLGRNADEAARELARGPFDHIGEHEFQLLPTEYSVGPPSFRMFSDANGSVDGWELTDVLDQPTDETLKDVMAVYSNVFGRAVSEGERYVEFRRLSPFVRASRRDGSLAVSKQAWAY